MNFGQIGRHSIKSASQGTSLMKILKIQVLRGPNVWSNYRKKLIQMRLDLQELENFSTNKIDGFGDRLKALLPTMEKHECSEGVPGGFFMRVDEGTWLGHVIEHVALELQSLAGMEAGYGRTRSTSEPGVYNVVFAYEVEEAGVYAAKAAVELIQALVDNQPVALADILDALRAMCKRNCLGPSTKSIVEEAERRGIPWQRLESNSWIQLGHGANQMQFQATLTGKTNCLAVDIAGNKNLTKKLLAKSNIPVAKGGICSDLDELKQFVLDIGYPLVVKPLDANQGKGVTINISSWDDARAGFKLARRYSDAVMVEQFVAGCDFRILVVNNKVVAAAKRIPAHVVGDGESTIDQLVERENRDPRRGIGHENVLTKIEIDQHTEMVLAKAGLSAGSVPARGQRVFLKSTANLSTGGTAIDVTDTLHPENAFLAERIARIVGLDICGIDIMADTLDIPLRDAGGVVLEVNAAPGFRMHLHPSEGEPRNVAAAVIDMLYPPGKPSRIPIIAVTGTNGKTTTTRLLAHMASTSGFRTGFTTTDGIYVNGFQVEKGDTTGPKSADFVLRDPTVEFAVLETARGGILRAGLAFHQCDVGIITNIHEDHLGLNDVHTVRDLANVKAVVARSVRKNGWAILNAEDEHCVRIARELDCKVAFFSLTPKHPVIKQQIADGKPVGVLENGYLTIIRGGQKIRVEEVNRVPITYDGRARFMVANALAATLAGYLWGFPLDSIRESLHTFLPGFEQTPGRLNLFEFNNFKVLIDYAHNPHGYRAVEEYLQSVPAARKIGIISGIGDRRDDDIRECAQIACRMFDHIIIRHEHDLRGRSGENIIGLLEEGISASDCAVTYEIIADESDAIRSALNMAQGGDLIVALSEIYQNVVDIVKNELKHEKHHIPLVSSNPDRKQPTAPALALNLVNANKQYYGKPA